MFNYYDNDYAGIPYNDINWYDVVGQPFGTASYFNAIIFGDANNIVDTKGAMAVGGNFTSQRGLTLGYGNDGRLTGTGYSPDLVRFLVGGDVAMQGALVVIGHVVAGGNFRAASGSTYMIGKDGSPEQAQELTELYQANGGSRYWRLSDRNTHYAVSSYDVPRYIPAERINADTEGFFTDAFDSISYYHDCITGMQPNGTVTEHYHEWRLSGNDPAQNVFLIDVRPNGLLNRDIRLDIPSGSIAIVKLRTGNDAHLQFGFLGSEGLAERTLYVFEDARNIYMEEPAAIWGSILAPQATFHAHRTGGTVSGNAALGSLAVNGTSGFEFHLYPFAGGVECREEAPAPAPAPQPAPPPPPAPVPPPPRAPLPQPAPIQIPTPPPVPTPPPPAPRPAPPPPPAPRPAPPPAPAPRPAPPPPAPPQLRPIPIPAPCPPCPPSPAPEPCPVCPEPETRIEIQPIPIPIPLPCPEPEKCQECPVTPGVIFGCIWGCDCGCGHEWTVKLYKNCKEKKVLLYCIEIGSCGCFEFKVPYDGMYLLEICPKGRGKNMGSCRPLLTLKNVGVADLMI
jgi:choice-of-anchor A domain-containing protein